MVKEEAVVIGALLLGFGFLGYIVPIGQLGSVTDVDNLCSSMLGQVGQAYDEQARKTCQMASTLSKLVYATMGIGVLLIIIGVVFPSKRSLFLCGECNRAFSTEAELHNHSIETNHSQKQNDIQGAIKYNKAQEVPIQQRIKKSPFLQGLLIGIVVVVLFWGIFSAIVSNTFYMSNNALTPDVNEGDLMHYQRIPFSQIKVGDIIAFIPSDKELTTKVGKVRSITTNDPITIKTSSNANPNLFSEVKEQAYIGKITSITPQGGYVLRIFTGLNFLGITGALFVTPIIILQIRKKMLEKSQTRN